MSETHPWYRSLESLAHQPGLNHPLTLKLSATLSIQNGRSESPSPHGRPLLLRRAQTDPHHRRILTHGCLHIDDIHDLTGLQNKEARSYLQPLIANRFVTSSIHKEFNLRTQKAQDRIYYWCKSSDAVNVIKYRIIQLRQEITTEYQVKAGPDFWLCPRCKSTFKELDIVPSGPEGNMLCLRCSHELDINPAATQDKDSHEGIMRLNEQLAPFNSQIAEVDLKIARGDFRELTFDETFSRRKPVPKEISGRTEDNWADLKQGRERDKAAGAVNEDDINLNLTSAAALSKEEAEREAERKRRIANNSLLPDWHAGGVVNGAGSSLDIRGGSNKRNTTNGLPVATLKAEDSDEKKPIIPTTAADEDTKPSIPPAETKEQREQDIMEQYMLDMQREQAEADRKRLQEAEEEDEEDEDDDDEFEDVPGTGTPAAGTPIDSSQDNNIQASREFEDDSSEAATPASLPPTDVRDDKRIKLEQQQAGDDGDSEEEFEDVG
ncbi:Transcription initiation factor IIE subunit alpha [Cyphellophora attinorum]|uniref:Transcription initiation factor IIE subunit alpha n=1 Tax=Cyphellophora attinorum TaxID=1664694 RepID=A0A0N1NYB8_9EURO|nr:Transcription initiation factor IIE subunit alpha [Phialophora attinorum]KPI39515.1 Transcription initiation factor IIE subunit alpha [Phialophora attinorum]